MVEGLNHDIGDSAKPDNPTKLNVEAGDAAVKARQNLTQGALDRQAKLDSGGDSSFSNPMDVLRAESPLTSPGRGTPREFQSQSLKAEGTNMPMEASFRGPDGTQLNGTLVRGMDVFKTTGADGRNRAYDVQTGTDGSVTLVNRNDRTERIDVQSVESQVARSINRMPPYDTSSSMTVRKMTPEGTPEPVRQPQAEDPRIAQVKARNQEVAPTGTEPRPGKPVETPGTVGNQGPAAGDGPQGPPRDRGEEVKQRAERVKAELAQGDIEGARKALRDGKPGPDGSEPGPKGPASGEKSPSFEVREGKPGPRVENRGPEGEPGPKGERVKGPEPGERGERGPGPRGEGKPEIGERIRGERTDLSTAEQAKANLDLRGRLMEGKLSPADIQSLTKLSPEMAALSKQSLPEALAKPEFRQAFQKVIDQLGQVKVGDLPGGTPGRAELGKIPGLDISDPKTQSFLQELGKRLGTVSGDGRSMTVSQLLQGMDAERSGALTKFLTRGLDTGANTTMAQLDQGNLAMLRNLLKGQGDASTTGRTGIDSLMQSLAMTARGSDGSLAASGRIGTLELGKLLSADGNLQLSDMLSRNLMVKGQMLTTADGRMMQNQLGDFAARLSPGQESMVRNMLTNSRTLSSLLDMVATGRGSGGDIANATIVSDAIKMLVRGEATTGGADFATRTGDSARSLAQADATAAGTRGDVRIPPGMTIQDFVSRMPIDPVSGMPYDPSTGKILDPATGRAIGDYRPGEPTKKSSFDDDEHESDEKKKSRKLKEDSEKSESSKIKAMMLLEQARKKAEADERLKAEKERKQKEEDEKRTKYVCQDGDTIQSVALKQLKDIRTAPLIYRINKEMIPLRKTPDGREVAVLHEGLVIWLPSPGEVKRFRGQLLTEQIESGKSGPTSSAPGKNFKSPEEELAAMFGANWAGPKAENEEKDEAVRTEKAQAYEPNSVEVQLMSEAMAAAKKRKENIEQALGPIKPSSPLRKRSSERTDYVVRLGDSLKSVSIKHPMLQDISLWRLLAEVNNLTLETDAKGNPKAALQRGSKIQIPSKEEILEFREGTGIRPVDTRQLTRKTEIDPHKVSKKCAGCGRLTVKSARLCPACGEPFQEGVPDSTGPGGDSGTEPLSRTESRPSTSASPKPPNAPVAPVEDTTSDGADEPGAFTFRPPTTPDMDAPIPDAVRGDRNRKGTSESIDNGEQLEEPTFDSSPMFDGSSNTKALEPRDGLDWEVLKVLDERTRISSTRQGQRTVLQLQFLHHGPWEPVIEYQVDLMFTLRRNFKAGEAGRPVKMDLPAAAARELAQNDLNTNWRNYTRHFLEPT